MFACFSKYFLRLYFVAIAALFAVLMAVGIWRHYSDVPFWDMWDGYLGFYTRAGQGWGAWWEQHNEHRLILSRLIFWVDLHCWHGSMVLPYILNGFFPLLIAGNFVFVFQRLHGSAGQSSLVPIAVAAVMVVLATSWVQHENFTWIFESQVFLAYLLPLLAFTLLAHAQAAGRRRSVWLAWLAGLASAGAMANGILALPLLTLQAWALRLRKRYICILLLTSVLIWCFYFYDYHMLGQNLAQKGLVRIIEHSEVMWIPYAGPLHAVRWLSFVRYLLLFLGGPWYFVLQKIALWPVMAAGVLWLILALITAWRVLRPPVQPYPVALLMLIVYIGAAALGVAHGRVVFGVEQALSSRYLTPQFMAWTALLLLGVYLWPRATASRLALGGYAAIVLLLLPAQLQGIDVAFGQSASLRIPALAIQLGIRDFERIRQISYDGERTFALVQQARRERLAVFGEPDMQLALRYWSGASFAVQISPMRCDGYVDAVESIPDVSDAVRICGWLYDPHGRQVPSLVLLSGGARGRGVALGGLWRPDVGQAEHARQASVAGFCGYLQGSALAAGTPVMLTGWVKQRPVCTLTLDPRQWRK
ncbi:MAG: hypothetical protein LBH10_04765 [Burkholderiaceae bacterium]|jgi:hypothetical protein|nr:hypothetical protein [Burkholderiaceae bacterium]